LEHVLLIVGGFEPDAPIAGGLHVQIDGMEGSHVDAGPEHQYLFAFISPSGTNTLGCCRDDIGEKTLVLFVIVGEKTADGVDSFVLCFEKRS
jgi:hypothetical protein